jgi:deaminated glutathione amidase
MTEIDPALVAEARGRIPSLQHGRRFEVAPVEKPRLHLVGKAS